MCIDKRDPQEQHEARGPGRWQIFHLGDYPACRKIPARYAAFVWTPSLTRVTGGIIVSLVLNDILFSFSLNTLVDFFNRQSLVFDIHIQPIKDLEVSIPTTPYRLHVS